MVSSEDLMDTYVELNHLHFEGKLPLYSVVIKDLGRWHARVYYDSQMLALHEDFVENVSRDELRRTLIHEMIHIDLDRLGYKNPGHTMTFWRRAVALGVVDRYETECYALADRAVREADVDPNDLPMPSWRPKVLISA